MKRLGVVLMVFCLIPAIACTTPPSNVNKQNAVPASATATFPAPTAGGTTTSIPGIGVRQEIMPTRNHRPEGTPIQYNTIPPTSSDHWPHWSNCGFFEEELPDERIVPNLEHSNIVVSYNLTSPEEIEQLREVLNSIESFQIDGVARPYSNIPHGTVALSAWGVSDIMQGIDKDRIRKLFVNYAGNQGPEGNIPCVNSGVMP